MLIMRSIVGVIYAVLFFSVVPIYGTYGAGTCAVIIAALLLAMVLFKFRAITRAVSQ